MGENTDFNEDMLLNDNVNLTGYSDTDDDDDNDNDDVCNAENTDQPDDVIDNTDPPQRDVDIDENIQPYDVDNNSDFNIDNDFQNCKFEEEEGLDEQVIQGFLKHIMQLQEQVVKKKKENRLIPCVSNFMKLDLDQKSQQISPTITRHLLHVCDFIVRNKLDIKIDHGDRGVLEYITSKDCPKKDIKFTFVEDMRIHDANKFNNLMDMLTKNNARDELLNNAKRSSEEAGLIESRQEAKKSVKNNASTAGNDIINFLRKTESYRKSVGLDQIVDDDDDVTAGNAPVPVTAGASGAGHKPGTVAASAAKIEEHLRKNNVKPVPQGIKYGDSELGISYQDMIEDLTRNYTQTRPNLNENNRRRVLLLLKKTNMPISYIRNKRIKEEYKHILNQSKQPSKLPTYIPAPQTKLGKERRKRAYLSD
ncbi:Hypothetical predicted protein [Paramuricea clavata]|uniref:Uncharacterized protein n=1 Tax=Paramuricea clavata TaxID=317549 RepID=A0A6S7FQ04_PARCT|nr:Hypothetical predicted protein [Paramuricea clavata]